MRFSKKNLLWFYLLISWYGMGAAMVESLVNYPSWKLIGAEGFTDYHQFLAFRITFILVIPLLVQAVLAFLLWWNDKTNLSLIFQNLLHLVFWVSSVFIQIPIQAHLDTAGKDLDLIFTLVETDLWLRTLPHVAQIVLASTYVIKQVSKKDWI